MINASGDDGNTFTATANPSAPDEDGSADLQHVLAVARAIGENIEEYRVVVDKSTVPVGTADKVKAEIARVLAERGKDIEFDVEQIAPTTH